MKLLKRLENKNYMVKLKKLGLFNLEEAECKPHHSSQLPVGGCGEEGVDLISQMTNYWILETA